MPGAKMKKGIMILSVRQDELTLFKLLFSDEKKHDFQCKELNDTKCS